MSPNTSRPLGNVSAHVDWNKSRAHHWKDTLTVHHMQCCKIYSFSLLRISTRAHCSDLVVTYQIPQSHSLTDDLAATETALRPLRWCCTTQTVSRPLWWSHCLCNGHVATAKALGTGSILSLQWLNRLSLLSSVGH